MALLIGFLFFVVCAWWWIRGSAFVAFALSLAQLGIVLIGRGNFDDPHLLKVLAVEGCVFWLPWAFHTYIKPGLPRRRQQVDLTRIGRPETYAAQRPRIPN